MNSIGKAILLASFFYVLLIIQTSFLPRFFSFVPNLILIAVVLANLFDGQASFFGFLASFFGGFFLDVFSVEFFGYYILICLLISIFVKFFLKKYIQPKLRLNL